MPNRIQVQLAVSAKRLEQICGASPELFVSDGVNGELHYAPDQLLDALLVHLRLKNDAALCRRLKVRPPVISKVRNRHTAVTSDLLISMHEESDLTIRDLRWLMGDRRERFTPFKPKRREDVD